jgi:hypothetical protein
LSISWSQDQEFIRARIVGQTLLWKHADLDVDQICKISDRLRDALEAVHIDDRIEFELGANPSCALSHGAGQNLACPPVNVLSGKGVLGGARPANRIGVTAGFRRGSLENVRLVEVNVALDEASAGQRAGKVPFRPRNVELRADCGDAAVFDRDIDQRISGACLGEPGIAEDKIH